MITVRRLFAIVVTTLTAGLLTLVPTSAAWAMLPPEPAGSGSSPTTVGVATAAGGLGIWQVASVAAVCAALAVLATLAVTRFLRAHRHGTPHIATA